MPEMRSVKKFVGFPTRSCPIGARDNDWLRLTGDDQRQVQSVAMERCDASIFAGGGDVRSGDWRAGGRYARPAVSPRQLHRRPDAAPRSTGRASMSAARRATAQHLEVSPAANSDLQATLQSGRPASTYSLAAAAQRAQQHARGFGGFFGYNSQWDDVVLGIEANYIHDGFRSISNSFGVRSQSRPLGPTA